MDIFAIITEIVFKLGLTLGVGSSTFALTFYIMALTDGKIDPSERRFLHAVYTVLRIGMFLIATGLILSLFVYPDTSVQYIAQWILLGVITLNALGMTFKFMPMQYGPTIAGGSWYSLFFASTLPLNNFPILTTVIGYVFVIVFLHVLLSYLKKRFHPPRPQTS